jgi:arylsulfatase
MPHPNILFIMTDQQRYDCVGANGNATIRTPHLDQLAGESANFASCFVQAPVCVPSRQTFFTGRYPHSHRNRVNYTPLEPSETLMQAYLRDAGYATGFVGKLHYWPPTREFALSTGFDRGLIHDAGPLDEYSDYAAWLAANSSFAAGDCRKCAPPAGGGNPYTALVPDELHETTWCGEKTREALREMANGDGPFFLFSSYWKPHSSFEVPEPWAAMYDDVEFPLPETKSLEHIQSLPLPVQRLALRSEPANYEVDAETLTWMYRSYYAAVSHIDREVGLTLDLIDELGLADNTVVVFCSDHGDLLHEHGINGKNAFYEGAIHVPMMIRFPGIVRPGRYDDLIETTDVLSTLFELAAVPVPRRNQGRSFARLVSEVGTPYVPRTHVFGENIIPEVINTGALDFPYEPGEGVGGIRHPDAKMVRTVRWKYNYYVGHGEELYDLENDPQEARNLATDPAHREVVQEMKDALLSWLITADEPDQIAPRWCTRTQHQV